MSYELNSKLSKLTPYDPITGTYRIRLDANESFFNIDDKVKNKILSEISSVDFNRYPDPYAIDTIKAFSDYYGILPEFVTSGNGSDELISIISSCFLEKGDKIVTLKPDFSMYAFYGSLYENDVLTYHKNEDLSVDIDKLIKFVNENNAKAIIFSNPCNPTSLGIAKDDVIKLIKGTDALVILDEAYMDFWSESIIERVSEFDNLIILRTCSKAAGMASIRLGFAIAGTKITNALRAAKSPYNCDAVSQLIGRIILSEKDTLRNNLAEIIKSRDYLYSETVRLSEQYSSLGYVYPTVTNFIFVKSNNSKLIFDELLKRSIAIRYMGEYIRITAGNEEENREVISALEEIIKNIE